MAKTGPAPKGEYAYKAKTLTTRITAELRAELDNAKEKSGRSLSQEIEYRLRRSFQEDQDIMRAFGSRKHYAIMRLISSVMDLGNNDRDIWLEDQDNFDHVLHTITRVLGALRPNGMHGERDPEAEETDKFVGDLNAAAITHDLLRADAAMPLDNRRGPLSKIKSDLGPLVNRLESIGESGMGAGERAFKRGRGK